jgi:predicted transcriptional regulator/transcriptional regulator with XRE-family HTH domain
MSLRIPIGSRIRRRRLALGLTQAALAKALGISASYLNLIENDKRAIGGGLLVRIGERLGIELAHLAGDSDLRIAAAIGELMTDPVMQGIELGPGEIRELVAQQPAAAMALVRLHRAYCDSNAGIEALRHRLNSDPYLSQLLHEILNRISGIKSSAEILASIPDLTERERGRFVDRINGEAQGLVPTTRNLVDYFDQTIADQKPISPLREVDEAIITHGNHFPVLEDVADRLSAELSTTRPLPEAALLTLLHDRFGIECRMVAREPTGPETADVRMLALPEAAPLATRVFRMLRRYAALAAGDVLEQTVSAFALTSEEARLLAHRALSSYIAAAMMMPYEPFLARAEERRYDIEVLGNFFGVSFEQVAHRFVTLRRPGSEGVPFGFLRVDRAGRMSKRFTLPGLLLPGSGHGCLLWPIYRAFSSAHIVRQVSVLPSGARFLQVARQVTKSVGGFHQPAPTFAIMLSCDMLHSDRTVYGDGLDPRHAVVETGPSCLLCPRLDCAHRHEVPA